MVELSNKRNDKKMIFVCGDFNVDLLKDHKMNRHFLDTMYSICLFPTILRPTRIICDSATLIDNIFINDIGNRVISGLLISDIIDHLPVFGTVPNVLKTDRKTNIYIATRHKTPEATEALRQDL